MKIAVALSGGGARCAAQLGYLEGIWDLVQIEALAGTSGGSIAAALLARGLTPPEALEVVRSIDYSRIRPSFRRGLLSLHMMIDLLRDLGFRRFEDLKLPLYVTVTDFETLEGRYISSGDLATALIASSSLIPLFAPTEFEGRLCIDGAFYDNLPVRPLMEHPFRLAINVNPGRTPHRPTLLGILKKAGYAALHSNITCSIPLASRYVEIEECANYGILDKKRLSAIYSIGKKRALVDKKEWERC
jgi:NTE family protein